MKTTACILLLGVTLSGHAKAHPCDAAGSVAESIDCYQRFQAISTYEKLQSIIAEGEREEAQQEAEFAEKKRGTCMYGPDDKLILNRPDGACPPVLVPVK